MDDHERVLVELNTSSGEKESLITSYETAKKFIQDWKTTDEDKSIEIRGIIPHFDGNECEYIFVRSCISWILIQKINSVCQPL